MQLSAASLYICDVLLLFFHTQPLFCVQAFLFTLHNLHLSVSQDLMSLAAAALGASENV